MIAHYELVREIGRGGFGLVFEANDLALDRKVAFKAICAPVLNDVRDDRLLREAEMAARLSHPNVVTLHDVGRCEHGPYLVLELLEGETLAAKERREPLPIGEALRVAGAIAQAIAHAHSAGVVHRDLTPGNVFLCDDGRVKVLDLGMAHAFGCRKLEGGTPPYMAPEQRRGAPEDERTDVFAMGVVLFEMLTRRLPFDRDASASETAAPRIAIAGAPDLGALIARMLDVDPVKRPRDGSVVAAALADVSVRLSCDPAAAARVRLEPAQPRGRGPRSLAALMAVAAVCALAAVAYAILQGRGGDVAQAPASPTQAAQTAIAVLPFDDLSPARDQAHFSEGLAEGILNSLAHVNGLRVAGRTSSFAFRGRNATAQEIARELNVAFVVAGSVRRDGDRIRVTTQLLSGGDGSSVWSERFDREITDVFAIQDEIARAVVRALPFGLLLPAGTGPESKSTADRGRATRVDAYNAYLLGHHHFTRGMHAQALEKFQAALAIDPGYAPALAGIALAALFQQEFDTSAEVAATRAAQALDAARRAVEAAPDLPEAYAARGLTTALFGHDWTSAARDLERALALRRDAETIRGLGILHFAQGRFEEARSLFTEATELDPLSPSAWNTLGALYLATGELDRALPALQRSYEISPVQTYAPGNIGIALILQGRARDAIEPWERSSSELIRLMGRAIVYQRLGNDAEGRAALDTMIETYGERGAFRIAQVYGAWGDRDRAMDWLERGLANGSARLAGEVKSHPFMHPLRGDPRYEALLAKLNLPVE